MLPSLTAGRCEQTVEHTSGGAPHSFDRWPDPCDLADRIPVPTIDQLIACLSGIGADDDRQAAEWCFDSYCEAALWAVCVGLNIPNRSIEDVSFATRFPVLTTDEVAADEAARAQQAAKLSEENLARKRAKRARYYANREARGLPARSPGRHDTKRKP